MKRFLLATAFLPEGGGGSPDWSDDSAENAGSFRRAFVATTHKWRLAIGE
jgi:hypothetical protein